MTVSSPFSAACRAWRERRICSPNCPSGVLQYMARPWPTTPTERLHLGRSMPLLHNPALHLKCRKALWGSVGPCAQAFADAGWRRPFSSGLRAWGASESESHTQGSAPAREGCTAGSPRVVSPPNVSKAIHSDPLTPGPLSPKGARGELVRVFCPRPAGGEGGPGKQCFPSGQVKGCLIIAIRGRL